MTRRHGVFLVIVLCLALLVSACGKTTAEPTTANAGTTSSSALQTTKAGTAAGTASQTTNTSRSTTQASGFTYARLDVLASYNIVCTMEAQAGIAANIVQKYDANHTPPEKAYASVRYMSTAGKPFVWAEECVVIGDSYWTKDFGKDWAIGRNSTAAAHTTELTLVYNALNLGKVEKLEETSVGGIASTHYSFTYMASEGMLIRVTGEIWVANQPGLPRVIVKASGEQGEMDAQGKMIEDAKHIKFAFDVKNINSGLTIKPPI